MWRDDARLLDILLAARKIHEYTTAVCPHCPHHPVLPPLRPLAAVRYHEI